MKKSLLIGFGICALTANSAIIFDGLEADENIVNGVVVKSATQDDWNNEQAKAAFYQQRDQLNLRPTQTQLSLLQSDKVPVVSPRPAVVPQKVQPSDQISSKSAVVNGPSSTQETLISDLKPQVRLPSKIETASQQVTQSQTVRPIDKVWNQEAKQKNFGNDQIKKPEWGSNGQSIDNSQSKASEKSSETSLSEAQKIEEAKKLIQNQKPLSVKYIVYDKSIIKPAKKEEPRQTIEYSSGSQRSSSSSSYVQDPVQTTSKVTVVSYQSNVVSPGSQKVILPASYDRSQTYVEPIRNMDYIRPDINLLPTSNLRSSMTLQRASPVYVSPSEAARQNIVNEVKFREQGRTNSMRETYYRA